jgi:hypothetical protein
MTAFEDLSEYRYLPSRELMLNVGWLGLAGGVPSGRFPAELIETLVSLAVRGERPMRGFHECDFCDVRSPIEKSIPSRGESVVLGMSELQVISASGQVFAAPSLIVHYIEAHDYLPPMEFIDALRAGREEELASAGIVHDLTSEVERLDGVTQAAQSTRGPLIAIDFTAESPDAVLARRSLPGHRIWRLTFLSGSSTRAARAGRLILCTSVVGRTLMPRIVRSFGLNPGN